MTIGIIHKLEIGQVDNTDALTKNFDIVAEETDGRAICISSPVAVRAHVVQKWIEGLNACEYKAVKMQWNDEAEKFHYFFERKDNR